MSALWSLAAEQNGDPIWLRTLATVLPVVGTTLVGVVAAPWLIEKIKQRNNPTPPPQQPDRLPSGPLPAPVVMEASIRAGEDPLVRMLVDSLNTRLSEAYEDLEEKNRQSVLDAGTNARLKTQLGEVQRRLGECERELEEKTVKVRYLYRKLEEVQNQLSLAQRKLRLAEDPHGSQFPDFRARPEEPHHGPA